MKKCFEILKVCAFLLPLVFFAALIIQQEYYKNSLQTWRVPIGGYSPRNFLYGHYLQFRFDMESHGDVLCLNKQNASSRAPQVPVITEYQSKKSCESVLKRGEFLSAQRFYIPEYEGRNLEKILRDRKNYKTEIDFTVLPTQKLAIQDMVINGESLQQFLKTHSAKK